MQQTYLDFNNVTKSYGNIQALKQVSLQVEPGEQVAILGSNGAGKSTFMSLASGVRPNDSGSIAIFGEQPGSKTAKLRMRILPQELSFPQQLKVIEILKLVSAHYDNFDFTKLIQDMKIEGLLNRKMHQLSGGQHKRVGIVSTLIGSPDLLMLDEPTANIDLTGRELVYDFLQDYLKQEGKSLIFSSHQMQEVEYLADRIVVLKSGQVVANGSTEEIKVEYGLKKVSFRTQLQELNIPSARDISRHGDKVTLLGSDSDKMLKEVIAEDANASAINVDDSSLDEIFLKLWEG